MFDFSLMIEKSVNFILQGVRKEASIENFSIKKGIVVLLRVYCRTMIVSQCNVVTNEA